MTATSEYRRDGFLLAAAVGVIGLTFGVLADAAGLSPLQVLAMSALVFTGASQFAAVGVIEGGGSAGAAVGSALLLAARNALYGPVIGPLLRHRREPRALAAHFVIDETVGMAAMQPDNETAARAFWWTGLWLYGLWNAGSMLGVALGTVIGEPETWGLDAAFPAAFVALLAPHVKTRPGQVAAFSGGALAIFFVPLAPAGVPLLAASLGVIPALLVARRGRP